VTVARLITRQSQSDTAAQRWLDHYTWNINGPGKGNHRTTYVKFDPAVIYAALVALGPTPSPDAVDQVVGNSSWTDTPTCSECGRDNQPAVVQVGEESDYESRTAQLCGDCLRRAADLIPPGA
jgi:hypothetical protein